ncbi:Hok/Gef family protein, partial [Escherichia coli]|uniref:Hok/Gef family protein n=1 Tax=Escherichia coli TaxID=562 RepID=UPI003C6D84E8
MTKYALIGLLAVCATVLCFSLIFRERLCEPRQPGGCKLKTAPVRPVVAARPAEYVCSEDLF